MSLWEKFSKRSPIRYHDLGKEQEEEEHGNPSTHAHYRKLPISRLILTLIISLLCLLASLGIAQLYLFISMHGALQLGPPTEPPKTHTYGCGENLAEAKARGCVFELMTISWVPPACHDPELDGEFRSLGLQYFSDRSLTQEISYEELSERTEGYSWSTNRYHLTHCSFMWRKMHRALNAGWRQTNHALDYEHTTHCSMLTYNASLRGELDTLLPVVVGFERCY